MFGKPAMRGSGLFSVVCLVFFAMSLGVSPAQVALADSSGSVSGAVYQADGVTPIANIDVRLATGSSTDIVCTAADGSYTFPAVPLGVNFRLFVESAYNVCGGSNGFVTEYWQGSPTWQNATLLSLDAQSPDLTHVDFTLDPGGTLSGTVYAPDGTTPLPHMVVALYGPGGQQQDACTDWSGAYTFRGVPFDQEFAAAAAVTFARGSCSGLATGYVRQFWPNVLTQDAATPFTLTAAAPEVTGVDFTLQTGATITGTVHAGNGVDPIPNALVILSGTGFDDGACTDANGDYSFPSTVPFGLAVLVQAAPSWTTYCGPAVNYGTEYWHEARTSAAATLLTLTPGDPLAGAIDFTLEATGSISGVVHAADGVTPLRHIAINASAGAYSSSMCSADDGSYTIPDVPFDLALRVRTDAYFDPWCDAGADYVSEVWQETPDGGSATLLTLTAGSPALTGIDFTLARAGSVSGTVYETDGVTPVANQAVSLNGPVSGGSDCTDSAGRYIIHDVSFDSGYRVHVDSATNWCGGATNYVPEYWQEAADWGSATLLDVSAQNPNPTGIDFTLARSGSISGTAFAADGVTPLEHIAINLGDDKNYSWSVCTNAAGQYIFPNPPLDRPLRVRADTYHDAWCNSSADYVYEYWQETLEDGPGLLTLTNAVPDRTGIDFQLDPAGSRSAPNLDVWYQDNIIQAIDWPVGTHLKLMVEDLTTPLSPDYSAEADIVENDSTAFDLQGHFILAPGMVVTVSGGHMSAIARIDALTITGVDPDLDVISGTTAPNNWLWMFNSPGACCRSTTADGSGAWTMNFAVPGPGGEPVVDIAPGSQGAAHVPSGDGKTSVSWRIASPATPTPTSTPTATATLPPVTTPTATPTSTDVPPTATPTATETLEPSQTPLPTGTATVTVTPTRTQTRTPAPIILTLYSVANQDGWMLESSENSTAGGWLNSTATTFLLGDDAANRQYRAILAFNTAALPDNAKIQSAVLQIKQSGLLVGANPFGILGGLLVDIRAGFFGSSAVLQLSDFNAAATALKVATFNKTPAGLVYSAPLTAVGRVAISRTGATQLRLRFTTDDNNNRAANYMRFLSSNAAGGKPVLVITYTLP